MALVAPTARPFSAEVVCDPVPRRARKDDLGHNYPFDGRCFRTAVKHGLFRPINQPSELRLFVDIDAGCESVGDLNGFGQRNAVSFWKFDDRHSSPLGHTSATRNKRKPLGVDAATQKLHVCNTPSRPANFTGRAIPPARFKLGRPAALLVRGFFYPDALVEPPARGLSVYRAPSSRQAAPFCHVEVRSGQRKARSVRCIRPCSAGWRSRAPIQLPDPQSSPQLRSSLGAGRWERVSGHLREERPDLFPPEKLAIFQSLHRSLLETSRGALVGESLAPIHAADQRPEITRGTLATSGRFSPGAR